MKKQTENPSRTLEIGVKVFLKNTSGKFLILKRAKPYHGQKIRKWDVPGGRIIPGEKQLSALKREVKEETGLTKVTVVKVVAVQDILRVSNKHTVRITYLASCKDNSVIKTDPKEHIAYRWASLSEIQKTRHDTYLKGVIEKLREAKKN